MKKRPLVLLGLSAVGAIASVGIGFTVAGFVGKAKVDAPIGESGVLGTYVFLETGIWTEEAGGASFCVYCWQSGGANSGFLGSTATTSEGYLVFNIDLDYYKGGGFQFVRYNDSTALSDLTWSSALEIIYNRSVDINIDANGTIVGANGKNLYTITGWGSVPFEDQEHHQLGTIAEASWTDTLTDS